MAVCSERTGETWRQTPKLTGCILSQSRKPIPPSQAAGQAVSSHAQGNGLDAAQLVVLEAQLVGVSAAVNENAEDVVGTDDMIDDEAAVVDEVGATVGVAEITQGGE